MSGTGKNQIIHNLTKGFKDIQVVMQEGNFKLFAKQVVVIVGCVLLLKYANGKFNTQIEKDNEQINSIQIQKQSEQEYLAQKTRLIELEPQFPDISLENQWLKGQILELTGEEGIVPQVSTPSPDSSNPTYLSEGADATFVMGYRQLGKFIEKVENNPNFLRISEITIVKDTAPDAMGNNKITLRLNTIFPKEKIGSKLFSDFDKQVSDSRQKRNSERNNAQKSSKRKEK